MALYWYSNDYHQNLSLVLIKSRTQFRPSADNSARFNLWVMVIMPQTLNSYSHHYLFFFPHFIYLWHQQIEKHFCFLSVFFVFLLLDTICRSVLKIWMWKTVMFADLTNVRLNFRIRHSFNPVSFRLLYLSVFRITQLSNLYLFFFRH